MWLKFSGNENKAINSDMLEAISLEKNSGRCCVNFVDEDSVRSFLEVDKYSRWTNSLCFLSACDKPLPEAEVWGWVRFINAAFRREMKLRYFTLY